MIYFAICESDKKLVVKMQNKIVDLFEPECKITIYESAATLYDDLRNKRIDIIFIDTFLPWSNGLNVASKVRYFNEEIEIILISTDNKFAIDAFKYRIFRYLLIELFDESLDEALSALRNRIIGMNKIFKLDTIDNKHIKIHIKNIFYAEIKDHDLIVNCVEGQYKIRKTMREFEDEVCGFGFIKVHNAFIVNLKYISRIDGDSVVMDNGETIRISKKYYNNLRKIFWLYSNFSGYGII